MLKTTRLLVATVFSLLVAGPAHAEDLKVGKVSKVFTGSEGEELAVVPLEGGTRALLRFRAVDGEFEGKVYLHDLHDLGDRGLEYQMHYQGKDYVSVLVRSGWGGERTWEMYPAGVKGRESIHVRYSETRSQALKPEQLLAEYQQQQRMQPAPTPLVRKPPAPLIVPK